MFDDLLQFYPTPKSLCEIISEKYLDRNYKTVLEPSAGMGDLIEGTSNFIARSRDREYKIDRYKTIYAIEQSKEFRDVLAGKKFRLLGQDFLRYNGQKVFDLILMNPPFINGADHLMKAIDIAKGHNTHIVCILNAETIKNPYTMKRKELLDILNENDAVIEYYSDSFITDDTKRKTDVEVAIVSVKFKAPIDSEFENHFSRFKRTEAFDGQQKSVAIVNKYKGSDIEILIQEFHDRINAMKQSIASYNRNNTSNDLSLVYKNGQNVYYNEEIYEAYYDDLTSEYWSKLFNVSTIADRVTVEVKEKFRDFIANNSDYEFCEDNIDLMVSYCMETMMGGIEKSIEKLFDKIVGGGYYSRAGEYESKNVHLYNGWKTNNLRETEEGFKINSKFILGYWVIPDYTPFEEALFYYRNKDDLNDIERVLRYFDARYTVGDYITSDPEKFCVSKEKSIYENDFMRVQLYKKGTLHVNMKSQELLDRFNTYIGLKRNWLPPSYGSKTYNEMDETERDIVDQFEGEKAYTNKLNDSEFRAFIGNVTTGRLLLN